MREKDVVERVKELETQMLQLGEEVKNLKESLIPREKFDFMLKQLQETNTKQDTLLTDGSQRQESINRLTGEIEFMNEILKDLPLYIKFFRSPVGKTLQVIFTFTLLLLFLVVGSIVSNEFNQIVEDNVYAILITNVIISLSSVFLTQKGVRK